jgi:DTW domain-containing protein YfiP
MPDPTSSVPSENCPRCRKPAPLCDCSDIAAVDNRVALLILQHPQEQDEALGTARLATLHLRNAILRVGLSWPSLAKALGRPADPRAWAVLYLGSARPADIAPGRDVIAVDRKGAALPDQDAALAGLQGVIVLDGTWSQAKALWWRNPWMLKARRVVLGPRRPSRYGRLRREPRREGLSTIEAAGLLLAHLEGRPEIETTLVAGFERMLECYRKSLADPGDDRS